MDDHEDPRKRKIAYGEVKESLSEVDEYVETCLACEDPLYKAAAAIAYLNHAFSQSFKTREDANVMLADLEARKLLVKAGNDGPIMIGYQRYQFGDFGLDQEDTDEVQQTIAKFCRGLLSLVSQERRNKTKEMIEKSDISMEEFLKDVPGKCFIEIPPESYMRDGKEKWRGGGSILVENQEKDILPILGVGSLENVMEGMKNMEVRLPQYTLDWDTPIGQGKAFTRVVAGVMDTIGLDQEEAEDYVRKMQLFWHLLRRGLGEYRHKEELNQLKEEYRSRAEITAESFFGLNGEIPQKGIAFLEFNGAFKQKDDMPPTYNLFFLATRSQESGRDSIEVVDAPEHVQQLLAHNFGKKFAEETNFRGLPEKLGRIFRGIRGQMDMANEIAKE